MCRNYFWFSESFNIATSRKWNQILCNFMLRLNCCSIGQHSLSDRWTPHPLNSSSLWCSIYTQTFFLCWLLEQNCAESDIFKMNIVSTFWLFLNVCLWKKFVTAKPLLENCFLAWWWGLLRKLSSLGLSVMLKTFSLDNNSIIYICMQTWRWLSRSHCISMVETTSFSSP